MVKRTPKKNTVADVVARMHADPQWLAMRARQDAVIAARAKELSRAQAPLLEELRQVGVQVAAVSDLVNTRATDPRAIPILLKHLQRPYPPLVREGIARALAVREAKVGWRVLLNEYGNETEKGPKDGLAVAIAAAADAESLGDVIALARDRRHGPSRRLLLRALTRLRAGDVLKELATDPDLEKEIKIILGRRDLRNR